MATISQLITAALQHHQSGRLQDAEQIYRQVLEADPNQPDALHLLGVIARQMGRNDIAVELIGRAIQLKGNVADFHNNLGGAYLDLQKPAEAVACFRRAVQLNPDYALGLSNLGCALRDLGQLTEAADCCRKAVRLNGELTDAHVNLGNVLRDEGKLDHAVACYHRALERNPNLAIAHNNLANTLKDLGKFELAIVSYRRALELNPKFAEAYSNLGNVFKDQGKLDEAIVCFYRSLELKPDSFEAFNNLGNVLVDQGKLDDAIVCCRKALELKPDYASAHNNLGNALKGQGRLDEAIDCYRKVLELKPADAEKYSNLLLTLQYRAGITLTELFAAHLEFDHRFGSPLRVGDQTPRGDATKRGARSTGAEESPHPHLASSERRDQTSFDLDCGRSRRRLRLGFVSADLARHPVGNFLMRGFEHLREEQVDVVCYSDRVTKDDLTNRFQRAASQWHDVVGLNDQQLAEQIREDRVEILFDLAGHTAHNRLLVFARKPAPIQISWIGYEGTTGLSAMDFLMADRYLIPVESERYYRERILRMPDGYICYEPSESGPPVGSPPCSKNGFVTFGSFNNLCKLGSPVIEVWAEILRRVPTARLILKYRGLGEESVRRRFQEAFAAKGIDPLRVDLLPPSSYAEYLEAYHKVDVALDPFPFNGGATTCEALWMGIPVVTCPGETFASRHSLSHLSNIGLIETIASDLGEYVNLAVSLAGNPARLVELRAELRERMAVSPLCDGKRFANNLVTILRNLSG